ncbi:MAG TPA: CPBP family intramembrane glutamic endopeptidase [Rhizomicrobium sp.]|jgi:hypothetical protein
MSQSLPIRIALILFHLAVVTVLAFGIPFLTAYMTFLSHTHFGTPYAGLPGLYIQHGLQLAVALVVIAALKWIVPGDYGLHAPREKSYVRAAILWGIFFGVLMTVVDYAPQLIAHTKPDAGFPLTPPNIAGWLFFEGVYVGPTEEIPFRALLVTYLALTVPGKLRIGRYEMNWAGIVVALLFALLHAQNFDLRGWPEALGQQIYAFALGVLYAYWLEKSKSIVAPIIGHNVGDVVEYLIMFAWIFWA